MPPTGSASLDELSAPGVSEQPGASAGKQRRVAMGSAPRNGVVGSSGTTWTHRSPFVQSYQSVPVGHGADSSAAPGGTARATRPDASSLPCPLEGTNPPGGLDHSEARGDLLYVQRQSCRSVLPVCPACRWPTVGHCRGPPAVGMAIPAAPTGVFSLPPFLLPAAPCLQCVCSPVGPASPHSDTVCHQSPGRSPSSLPCASGGTVTVILRPPSALGPPC